MMITSARREQENETATEVIAEFTELAAIGDSMDHLAVG